MPNRKQRRSWLKQASATPQPQPTNDTAGQISVSKALRIMQRLDTPQAGLRAFLANSSLGHGKPHGQGRNRSQENARRRKQRGRAQP